MDEIRFLDEELEPIIDAQVVVPHGQPCSSCGSPVEDDDHFCSACGATHSVAGDETEPTSEAKGFRCDNCGSEVVVESTQRSYVCAFCDSTFVVEFSPVKSGRQDPEFVIGFAVTKDQALELFRNWIGRKQWFRPGNLRTAMVADKMVGVYLPFWRFSMLALSSWTASIGEYWYRTERYLTTDSKGRPQWKTRRVQETEWWPLQGRHHKYHHGYLVSGSRGLDQVTADQIKPFQLPALKRYRPYFLAGWLCEEYSVDREPALQSCLTEFRRREEQAVGRFLPGDTSQELSVNTRFDHIQSDLCLLPIYILSYQYQGRLYRFVVNGQTGKFWGNKPLSWRRILGVIGGLLLLIMAIIILFSILANV